MNLNDFAFIQRIKEKNMTLYVKAANRGTDTRIFILTKHTQTYENISGKTHGKIKHIVHFSCRDFGDEPVFLKLFASAVLCRFWHTKHAPILPSGKIDASNK